MPGGVIAGNRSAQRLGSGSVSVQVPHISDDHQIARLVVLVPGELKRRGFVRGESVFDDVLWCAHKVVRAARASIFDQLSSRCDRRSLHTTVFAATVGAHPLEGGSGTDT